MTSLVDISNLSTFKLKGYAKELIRIKNKVDILSLPANFLILGSGSNTIFSKNTRNLSIAKIEIKGIEINELNNHEVIVSVGAGEVWDYLVSFTVENGFSGLEALSAIPGTVGAAPVQNIGAYGTELKDTLVELEAYDFDKKKFVILKNADCNFNYRDSIFKKNPGKWLITNVSFKLKKDIKPVIPKYKDVENYFIEKPKIEPTLHNTREAIIKIRANKLPDPSLIPNCGSFFKNPIIESNQVKKLKSQFPNIPLFPFGDMTKVSAGFLIELAGFKGKKINNFIVYQNNALVLTNPNNASFSDLTKAIYEIRNTVFEKFDILLEPEVNIV